MKKPDMRNQDKKWSPKYLYRKYYRNRFFNKIFLIYILITIISSFILFIILTKNLTTIKYDQAMDSSVQILETVDSFMEGKLFGEKSVHQKLIRDNEYWRAVTDFLNDPKSGYYTENLQDIRQSFIQMIYAIDMQFGDMFLYGSRSGKIMQFGNTQDSIEYSSFEKIIKEKENLTKSKRYLFSSRKENSTSNTFSLFILDTIRDPNNFINKIGNMAISFNVKNIRLSYQRFDKYKKGNIYVLDDMGKLLFDSSAAYNEGDSLPFYGLKEKQEGRIREKNFIYNSFYNSEGGYYIVNAIPMTSIMSDVKVLQQSIFRVMMIVLIMAVVLNYLSTKLFSNRVKAIKGIMEQVKHGKLTDFGNGRKYDDEVGYIHTELIEMCAVLDNHIKKEYIYQLRQKEMELYALQAQIDPHFLYNSLEAIRMNLYLKGEDEASQMIRILSEMFRNIMKKDVVVTNAEEINYVKSYLQLYRFRLGSRMEYEFDISEEIYRYATIKHILQPIIENALVHGIQDTGTKECPSKILISAFKKDEDIYFTVQDDGRGISADRLAAMRCNLEKEELFQESIGIYNVNSRLKIVYGQDYKIEVYSEEHVSTKVILRIKAMKKKELKEYVQGIDC